MVDESLPSIQIRTASAADNLLLAEIGAETFHDSFAAENTPEDMAAYLAGAFGPEIQSGELADPASRFLIAEVEGLTVGYARLKFGPPPTAIVSRKPVEVARFYARKAWIGKGVGRRLMQACLLEAEWADCDVIWLDVWERNLRAIAFYRRWGFVEVGAQGFKLGADLQQDLLMSRAVNPDPA